jgi:hypothetical protein
MRRSRFLHSQLIAIFQQFPFGVATVGLNAHRNRHRHIDMELRHAYRVESGLAGAEFELGSVDEIQEMLEQGVVGVVAERPCSFAEDV